MSEYTPETLRRLAEGLRTEPHATMPYPFAAAAGIIEGCAAAWEALEKRLEAARPPVELLAALGDECFYGEDHLGWPQPEVGRRPCGGEGRVTMRTTMRGAQPVSSNDVGPLDLDTLRAVTAQALEYGAAYFSDSPMGHFTSWLQAQVLKAEREAAARAEEKEE